MLPWKLRKRLILPVKQNLSSVYFYLLVSCNLFLAMTWQMTYTHKLPKLCSATLMFLGAKRPQWRRASLRRNGCFRRLANYLPQGCVPPYYAILLFCLFRLCALFFRVTFHGDLKSGIGTNVILLWCHFSSY